MRWDEPCPACKQTVAIANKIECIHCGGFFCSNCVETLGDGLLCKACQDSLIPLPESEEAMQVLIDRVLPTIQRYWAHRRVGATVPELNNDFVNTLDELAEIMVLTFPAMAKEINRLRTRSNRVESGVLDHLLRARRAFGLENMGSCESHLNRAIEMLD